MKEIRQNPIQAKNPLASETGGMRTLSRPGDNTAQLQAAANQSTQVNQLKALNGIQSAPAQMKDNKTGLPDQLKSGVEGLSGISMDDVKVHYNSDKPANLQAHAYAQGTDIHLAPGQEQHLPHEAWHVVQQKQGRVQPTTQLKGKTAINDDAGLEKEADVMGAKAAQMKAIDQEEPQTQVVQQKAGPDAPAQLARTKQTGRSNNSTPRKKKKNTSPKNTNTPKKRKTPNGGKKNTAKKVKQYIYELEKGNRYGGHDTKENKEAILETIEFRNDVKEDMEIKELSLPEQISLENEGFGLENITSDDHMSRGTAICHKLAESEILKGINKLIDDEYNSKSDEKPLDEFLNTLIDKYINPSFMLSDYTQEDGKYAEVVTSKYKTAVKAFGEMQKEKVGSKERWLKAHEVGKCIVNNPVNLFNGSSTMNSSIHEHLDSNTFIDNDDEICRSPRSERAYEMQQEFPTLISGFTQNDSKKTKTSSLNFY